MTPSSCASLVMVVDDDADLRRALVEVLEDHEFQALEAANGQEALDGLRAAREHPCIILLDMMMPVMDGREFREAQRDDPMLGAIPIIVLSAHADVRRSAAEMGAAAALKKPVRLTELLDTVRRFCSP